jgi:lipid II:glycine glycyltransferase (peptidoglycan interpeptide bridge formation enzyme)
MKKLVFGMSKSIKDKYRELCKIEKTIPIFSKDWWMDAVCGENNWDVLLIEKNDEIIASMTYYMRKKYGLKIITQPSLTQTSGIWIKYPKGQKISKRLSYQKEVMNNIINQLEELKPDYYCQNFHYSIDNWQPFYWRGFQQTTRYTYIIEDLSNLDMLYKNMSANQRNHLKKASKTIKCEQNNDPDLFYKINTLTFKRQNKETPYSLEIVKRITKLGLKNNAIAIWFAKDNQDNICSTIFVVWDEFSVYLLMSGADPKYRSYHSKNLLIWEVIKHFSQTNRKFDFEGSMVENIADYNRGFGAIQKPYFNISKYSRKFMFLFSGKEMLKALLKK